MKARIVRADMMAPATKANAKRSASRRSRAMARLRSDIIALNEFNDITQEIAEDFAPSRWFEFIHAST
jgi:hypothetical protein